MILRKTAHLRAIGSLLTASILIPTTVLGSLYTPETSSHFTPWTTAPGITSYLLNSGSVPFNQAFYYTQPMMSADGRYLWFTASHNPADRTLMSTGFDDASVVVGTAPTNWIVTTPSSTTATTEVSPEVFSLSDVNALRLVDGNATDRVTATRTFGGSKTRWVMASWRYREDSVSGQSPTFRIQSGSTVAIELTVNGSSELVYRDGVGSTHLLANVTADTWYSLKVVADPGTDTFDVWVGGIKLAAGVPFIAPVSSLDRILFGTGINNTHTLWIDSVSLRADAPFLGLVDFQDDSLHFFEDARFEGLTPLVDRTTGDIYYVEAAEFGDGTGYKVYRQAPNASTARVVVNTIPKHESGGDPRQVASTLTFNASKSAVVFDAGNYDSDTTYLGTVPLNGTAPVTWATFPRRMDHAQLNPQDDTLMVATEDNYTSRVTGAEIGVNDRIWFVYDDGTKLKPFLASTRLYHEWWDPNGDDLWYLDQIGETTKDGSIGTVKFNLVTGKTSMVWEGAIGHSHADVTGRYLVGDHNYKTWATTNAVSVSFYDAWTDRKIEIVPSMPYPEFNQYHVHPHPHIEANGYVIFTSTVDSAHVRVAMTPLTQLQAAAYFVEKTYEAERTSYTTNSYVYDTTLGTASKGIYQKLNASGASKYVEYTVDIPETGEYEFSFSAQSGGDVGQYTVSIDGTAIGSTLDGYGTTAWITHSLGSKVFTTAGAKTVRFTVTGKNATSSGYVLRLDYFRLRKMRVIEAEAPGATNSTIYTYADVNRSGGSYIKLNATAAGKYVDYSITVPTAGTWTLSALAQRGGDAGQYSVTWNGLALGGTLDTYGTSAWTTLPIGARYFPAPGTYMLRLECVGKNTSSSGYVLRLDGIKLVKDDTFSARTEAETTSAYTTNGTMNIYSSNSSSNGAFVRLRATTTGKYVEYTLNAPAAGHYEVIFASQSGDDSGQYQLALDGVDVGLPIDFSLSNPGGLVSLGTFNLSSGNHALRFTGSGKSGASSNYYLRLDYLQITPINQ